MEYRRVRHLHLQVPNQGLAQRASFVMEDALRTADLFCTEPSLLFVVRLMNVGRMPVGAGPVSASRQVEDCLREILGQAIFAGRPEAAGAPAVYFLDFAQALTLFVRRLAAGGTANEWFWSLVIPGWRPSAGPASGLRLALAAAKDAFPPTNDRLSYPAAGQAALLDSLLEESPAAFNMLLGALTSSDVLSLLAQSGWSPMIIKRDEDRTSLSIDLQPIGSAKPAPKMDREVSLPMISFRWRSALRAWVARWGAQDSRLSWLCGLALVSVNPAYSTQPALLSLAARKLQLHIASEVEIPRLSLSHSPLQADSSFLRQPKPAPENRVLPLESRESPQSGLFSDVDNQSSVLAPSYPLSEKGLHASDASIPNPDEFPILQDEPLEQIARPFPEDSKTGLYTQWSGLYFLLPALVRLGFPKFLEADPEYIELGLPQRILRRAAAWAGVPADDSVLIPLGPAAEGQGAGLSFVAPAAWESLLVSPGRRPVWYLNRHSDVRLLSFHSRLSLAIWTGRAPEGVHRWLQSRPAGIQRDHRAARMLPRAEHLQTLDFVLDAWLSALRRWMRLSSGLGLSELLNRPGRLFITRTHLDVVLPLAAADLRIRRAGLDLDPGWLPWLGRVVQFKYLEE
jgi:hypothetical protein